MKNEPLLNPMSLVRTVVINLDRDQKRLSRFYNSLPDDWPFPQPLRFPAIDGNRVPTPSWWKAGAAPWGCFRSHQAVIEQALNDGIESILVLEDDAVCIDNFRNRFGIFARELPDDWEWVYLGGQHIQLELGLPVRLSEHIYRPFNAHRSHAYAIRGQRAMQLIYGHLNEPECWGEKNHVDHRFGELHANFPGGLYCPDQWLVGQSAGYSNIKRKHLDTNFFPDARSFGESKISCSVVAVAGDCDHYRKAIAAVLHRLGVSMGVANPPDDILEARDSYAAPGLETLCNSLVKEPLWHLASDRSFRVTHLRRWASQHESKKKTDLPIIGATCGKLAMLLPEISVAWSRPKLILVNAATEPPVTGLRALHHQKISDSLMQCDDHAFEDVLRLDHGDLANPDSLVDQLHKFVGVNARHALVVTAKQIAAAAAINK